MKTKERNTASSLGVPLLLLSIGLGAAPQAHAQDCEIEFSVFNKDRYVYGPVATECGGGVWPFKHSAPFGNWGVKTETSDKEDGNQFQGWCRNRYLCDNNNRCKRHCTDAWYEWNSCTTHSQWSPPNSDFYNYNNNRQQKSTRGDNQHGGGYATLGAPCPSDSDGDGVNDEGGCKATLSRGFSVRGHRMELYELDPASPDTHVETLRFPTLTIAAGSLKCSADYCGKSAVGGWQSPSNARSSSKTSAKAAVQIIRAVFSDPDSDCPCDPQVDPSCLATGGS